jgi:cupin fold WbuC family metalloprotein
MSEKQDYPMALSAPESAVTPIGEALLPKGKSASRESPRKRVILPLHQGPEDVLQRMLNFLQPGSYIRPHRHASDRAESLIVLSGTLLYLTFDDQGSVARILQLKAGADPLGVDIDGGIWHSFLALEPDTVLFEVKPGPYNAEGDKEFAPWAPEEYSGQSVDYLEALRQYSTTS